MKQIRVEYNEHDNNSSMNRTPNSVKRSALQRITRKPMDNTSINIPLSSILKYDEDEQVDDVRNSGVRQATSNKKIQQSQSQQSQQSLQTKNNSRVTKPTPVVETKKTTSKISREITKQNDDNFAPLIYTSQLFGIENKLITGIHISTESKQNEEGISIKFDIEQKELKQQYYMLNYRVTSNDESEDIFLATIKKSDADCIRLVDYSNLDLKTDYKLTFTIIDIFEKSEEENSNMVLQEIIIDLLPVLDFIPKNKIKQLNPKINNNRHEIQNIKPILTPQKSNNQKNTPNNNNNNNNKKDNRQPISNKKQMTIASNLMI